MRSTRSEGRPSRDSFYQTPTEYSEEETQRIFGFMEKLKQANDERGMFPRLCRVVQYYRSGCITYNDLKNALLSILRGKQGLLDEFLQLLSSFVSPVIKDNENKSDVERTVGFLNKIEALGDSVYRAFINALAFPGDIESLMEQLDEILRDHTSLKEEFETFLIDSRLLKRNREENVEDKYMKEDMLLSDLASAIEFALRDSELPKKRPPLGFNRVLEWFCRGKEVPEQYRRYPKRAAINMLPMLQYTHEEMTRARTSRVISQKGNPK